MKRPLRNNLFLFLLLFAIAARADEPVPVELDWEEVSGAKIYELEFQTTDGKVLTSFESKSPVFKFKMRVGHYRVRSRVADARKVYGDWSGLNEIVIQPKPVTMDAKSVTSKGIIDPKTRTAAVNFQWPASAGADKYRIRIFDAKGKKIAEKILSSPQSQFDLPAGDYTATVSSIGAHDIESDPVTLPEKIHIQTAHLEKPQILLEQVAADPAHPEVKEGHLPLDHGVPVLRWQPLAMSQLKGVLEYRYFFGDEWIPVESVTKENTHEWRLEKATLKPGRYRVTAWSEAAGLEKSESVSYEFVIKPSTY